MRRTLELAAHGAWIAGTVSASFLAFLLTGRAWLAAACGTVGMLLSAWHSVKTLATARGALAQSEQERSALEQALRRSQKMEALGQLAVGIAHDFNNHLTVISSNVELVARRLDGPQERLLRHTEAALQGVQRAAALTGRLLSSSRDPSAEPEAVEVDRLVGAVSGLLRRTLADRIGLDLQLSNQPWLVWADVNQMEAAVLALAVRSRDQVQDGARLTIAVSNMRLDAVCQVPGQPVLPGDYIQIAFGDADRVTGLAEWLPAEGVSAADLAMPRAFVRASGGYLLRSAPQAGGLSLRLLLPRFVPLAQAGTLPRHDTGGRVTILVVEDDAAVRSACVEVLRDIGYRVLDAPDAMEAFRLIADHGGIDLLFTDLGLPGGVSGRALADAARNIDPGMKVLFTTGYEHLDPASHSGASLLRKPFTPAELVGAVGDMLVDHKPADRPPADQPDTAATRPTRAAVDTFCRRTG